MAFGKMRNNKRSSSTSYTSTITTIVFIALCVLGVWMLTSNSLMPPQTTTRTTRSTTTTTNVFPSSADSHPIKPIHKKDDSPAFEDNPGNLPEDAIKSDEHYGLENIKVDEKSPDEQENGGGNGKADEDINTKEQSSSVFEKISQVMKGKESAQEKERQNEHETQMSEESSLTQNQQAAVQKNNEITSEQRNSEAKETQQIRSNDNEQLEDSKMEEQNGSEKQFESRESSQKSLTVKKQQQKQGDAQQNEISEESRKSKAQQNETPEESQTAKEDQESHKKKVSNTSQKAKQGKMKKDGKAATQSNPSTPKKSEKTWSTQADQSENEKERRKDGSGKDGYKWLMCNVTAGADYIPCLDNEKAISKLRTRKHYEHRERHCPEEGPTCLVPIPQGYKKPIEWPTSRDKIWYHNVPHTLLAEVKGHQNWVKLAGEFLTFPGGGTQFIHGALHYIDFIEQSVPKLAWGKHTRVIMDVGCGVASFGGFLFEREVIAMSFAPKDEHEAQVQFALERGIPAISAVMGTQRLPFPSGVFDLVHCARCRVPWHINGGALLLELNRVMRPGSYFVWSATPVYQKVDDDEQIWREMSSLTTSMCWELVTIKKDPLNFVGAAIYQKPMSNECYDRRKNTSPPMCKSDDDPNAAWYVPLQSCMHRVPVNGGERGSKWPEVWPRRLQTPPYWLNSTQIGIYGKPAPDDFTADHEQWKQEVNNLYLKGMGISWSNVRNVMDMRAVYGGFAAALKDLKVWVFNVVNIDSEDTLPIIYERGLFGIYHDWCESFSTYPRTYDLLHADHLFSRIKKRCNIVALVAEIDRIVRPGGNLIVRDESSIIGEIESLLKSLHWEVQLFSKDQERVIRAQKTFWRPVLYAPSS